MIILEQIKTRESIITFIKINDEVVIKKQFINTLVKVVLMVVLYLVTILATYINYMEQN